MHKPTLYRLENEFLIVEFMDVGGRLITMRHHAVDRNVLLSFEHLSDYCDDSKLYLNALIGPTCGRVLDQQGTVVLHGGSDGIENDRFSVQEIEQGYELKLTKNNIQYLVRYTLVQDELYVFLQATASQPQRLSLTQHNYFCLGNSESVAIRIDADDNYLLDSNLVNGGERMPVSGTVFDCTKLTPLASLLQKTHPQFVYTRHIDHPFIMRPKGKTVLDGTDLFLEIQSTLPIHHVYLGNYIDDYGFKRHSGIAIEPQIATALQEPNQTFFQGSMSYKLQKKKN